MDRITQLIEVLKALAEVQRNEETIVNRELQAVLNELMIELKLKK